VSACDISDACDKLRCPAVRTGAILPAFAGCASVAGVVSTVTLASGDGLPLAALLDVLAAAQGDIVLVDLGGRTDVQCWGAVLAAAAVACGKRAAIVNGAVRDVEGLAAAGFPTFARGVHPARMSGRLALVGADLSVTIDGGTVRSGSVAAASASGIVFVPRERAGEVFSLARNIATAEHELLADVRGAAEPAAALRLIRNSQERS
jgi:regulator of RNase E activity RraA